MPRGRYAFSTLGCSGLALSEVARLAISHGWPGLELRAAVGEPVHSGLDRQQRQKARALLEACDLSVVSIAGYTRVGDTTITDQECIDEVLGLARLAADIGAQFVRVFPARGTGADAEAAMVRRLRAIGDGMRSLTDPAHGGGAHVSVAVETHDAYCRGDALGPILDAVDDPRILAVWDVLHPWRCGEPMRATAKALLPRVAYVQIKDVASLETLTPRFPGEGLIPLDDALRLLAGEGYEGWISLEWESLWHPEAAALPDALVHAGRFLEGM